MSDPGSGGFLRQAFATLAHPIPEIDLDELDGIPLFHTPEAGATILTFAFGVGRPHEPVVRYNAIALVDRYGPAEVAAGEEGIRRSDVMQN